MTRQAGEEQILYFLDLLFQPADVRLCDTALSLDRFLISPMRVVADLRYRHYGVLIV